MERKEIEEIPLELFKMAEPEFQAFSSRLLPGTENIIGVRLPKLRKLAKRISKKNWQDYLLYGGEDTFEEVMLKGMLIGYAEGNPEQILPWVEDYLPKIKNWSVCDSFCSGLKLAQRYPEELWEYILPHLQDNEEFIVRFAVVMLLFYFVQKSYVERVLALLDQVSHPGYYVKTAVAWAVSICFIKLPEETMAYLKENHLDKETYNKALQKIVESHCVDKGIKALIRSMKR